VTPVALFTVTETDCAADPPGPLQLRVYMVVVVIAPVEMPLLLIGCEPLHPPLAVQLVALLVVQARLAELPEVTTVGEALSEMTGADGDTETMTDVELVPPAPLQLREKVEVAFSAGLISVPLASFDPVQAPEAVHDVEPVTLQVSVVVSPIRTVDGLALRAMVGCPVAMVMEAFAEVVPPAPVHCNVKVESVVTGPTDSEPLTAFAPLQAPEAVHAVASVLVQLRVVLTPATTLAAAGVRVTVGSTGALLIGAAGCPPLVQATDKSAESTSNVEIILYIMQLKLFQ
jgi:hypothetical protein